MHRGSTGIIWSQLESSRVIWSHLETYGIVCNHLESSAGTGGSQPLHWKQAQGMQSDGLQPHPGDTTSSSRSKSLQYGIGHTASPRSSKQRDQSGAYVLLHMACETLGDREMHAKYDAEHAFEIQRSHDVQIAPIIDTDGQHHQPSVMSSRNGGCRSRTGRFRIMAEHVGLGSSGLNLLKAIIVSIGYADDDG